MNRLINNIDEKWFEYIVMFSISNPNENVSSGEVRVLTRNGVFFMSATSNKKVSTVIEDKII